MVTKHGPKEQTSSFILLVGLITGALLVGFVLCFPVFSFWPFFWGFGLAASLVLTYVVGNIRQYRVELSSYLVTGLGYSVLFAAVVFTFTGVHRIEAHECHWRKQAEHIEIDLSPVGFGWSPVSSDALLDRLQQEQPTQVRVEVRITRDFGRVRARGKIQRVDGIPVRE